MCIVRFGDVGWCIRLHQLSDHMHAATILQRIQTNEPGLFFREVRRHACRPSCACGRLAGVSNHLST